MLSIPLPFVIALFLAILLGLLVAQRKAGYRAVVVFLGVCIALLMVVGLRWSFDLRIFRFLQPVIAALLPATAWLCFAQLQGPGRIPAWLHFLPAGGIFALSAAWAYLHPPIDALLAALFLGYGALLLRRGFVGPDSLPAARFGEAVQAGRAAMMSGALLIVSGGIDLAIAWDLALGAGDRAVLFVNAGSLIILPLVAVATILIARSAPESLTAPEPHDAPRPEQTVASPDDDHVLAEVNRILAESQLYHDPDLTLRRLARRLGIPERQVSGAINRKLGLNVSQAINNWRIREAMQLLGDTDRAVTTIMFDCGFQTKSNFNREFLRVAGTSPSEWRRRARLGAAPIPKGSWPEMQ